MATEQPNDPGALAPVICSPGYGVEGKDALLPPLVMERGDDPARIARFVRVWRALRAGVRVPDGYLEEWLLPPAPVPATRRRGRR